LSSATLELKVAPVVALPKEKNYSSVKLSKEIIISFRQSEEASDYSSFLSTNIILLPKIYLVSSVN